MKIQNNKLERFKKKLGLILKLLVLVLLLGLQGCAMADAVKDVADMTSKIGSVNRTIKNL